MRLTRLGVSTSPSSRSATGISEHCILPKSATYGVANSSTRSDLRPKNAGVIAYSALRNNRPSAQWQRSSRKVKNTKSNAAILAIQLGQSFEVVHGFSRAARHGGGIVFFTTAPGARGAGSLEKSGLRSTDQASAELRNHQWLRII